MVTSVSQTHHKRRTSIANRYYDYGNICVIKEYEKDPGNRSSVPGRRMVLRATCYVLRCWSYAFGAECWGENCVGYIQHEVQQSAESLRKKYAAGVTRFSHQKFA